MSSSPGDIASCFSMTEPHGGADPKVFTTRATRDGDEWVIDGYKWFSSNARFASFLIVMAVSDPEVSPYEGMSMFLVPTDTPGVKIVRNTGLMGEEDGHGTHAYIHYDHVRVPAEHLLGRPGCSKATTRAPAPARATSRWATSWAPCRSA